MDGARLFWDERHHWIDAGTVWYFVARDTPEKHALVSASELAHIQTGRTAKSANDGQIAGAPSF